MPWHRLFCVLLLVCSIDTLCARPIFQSPTQDETRLAAQQMCSEGDQLRKTPTAETLTQAIQKYQTALEYWQKLGDQASQAETHAKIGNSYLELGNYSKALAAFEQALHFAPAAKNPKWESDLLIRAGSIQSRLDQFSQAQDKLSRGLAIKRELGDATGEANALTELGVVSSKTGDHQKAIQSFSDALARFRTLGNQRGELFVQFYLGQLYIDHNEHQTALGYYQSAVELARTIKDQKSEATALTDLGLLYAELGEKFKALECYALAASIYRTVQDNRNEATLLTNIGKMYSYTGQFEKALTSLQQALVLERATQNLTGEGITLTQLGQTWSAIGEYPKALENYTRALELFRTTKNQSLEAVVLDWLGIVHCDLNQFQESVSFFQQAMALNRTLGNTSGEAKALANLGRAYVGMGNHQKSLELYQQALVVNRQRSGLQDQAANLAGIGVAYSGLGNHQKALEAFREALPRALPNGNPALEARLRYVTAKTLRDLNQLDEAKTQVETAIQIVEQIRADAVSSSFRESYLASVRNFYELYISLLTQLHLQQPSAGYDAQAFHVSERAHARSLLELLTESGVDLRQGVDSHLLEQEQTLKIQLKTKLEYLAKVVNGTAVTPQGDQLQQEVDSLTEAYQRVQAEIRQKSPRYAALTQPQPLTLPEIQKTLLDADSLLLEYTIGDAYSCVFAITPTSIKVYPLPKRSEIEALTRQVVELINQPASQNRTLKLANPNTTSTAKPTTTFKKSATALSQMVLGPVAAELGQKKLLIVADGPLNYLPFAVLPDPNHKQASPLIEHHEIINLPSASVLAAVRQETRNRPLAEKMLAVVADPVFGGPDDDRLNPHIRNLVRPALNLTAQRILDRIQSHPTAPKSSEAAAETTGQVLIPRLPGTRAEANQIANLLPVQNVLKITDFEATRELITSNQLSRFQYVHFATHGFLDTERPQLSALVLSMVDKEGTPKDGFLRAFDVYNLNLPAELVVLSACETGLGKSVNGEGLVGLTRGFMYAGTKRVIVSLWSVSDAATSDLMTRFYKKLLVEKQRPAAALRAAQLELIRNTQWKEPFYWAPFIIQGEWK